MSEYDELYERHLAKLLTVRREMGLDTIESAINLLMHMYEQNKDSEPLKHVPWQYANGRKTIKVYEDEEFLEADTVDERDDKTKDEQEEA